MFVCVDDLTVYSENIGLEYTVKMWTIFRETLTACTLKFWLYGCAVKFATMYSEKLEMYSKTLCAVKSLSRYGEHWTVCSENFDWEGVMWNLRQSAMKFMTFDSKQCDCVSVCASKHITVDSGQFFLLGTVKRDCVRILWGCIQWNVCVTMCSQTFDCVEVIFRICRIKRLTM